MMTRPSPRPRRLSRLPRCALALSLLLIGACSRFSPPHACPMYRLAPGVSVSASSFFAAHPAAHEMCVNGARCVPRQPAEGIVGTFVPAGEGSSLSIRIRVLTAGNAILLDKTVRVALHAVAGAPGCPSPGFRGSVTVTGQGALIAS